MFYVFISILMWLTLIVITVINMKFIFTETEKKWLVEAGIINHKGSKVSKIITYFKLFEVNSILVIILFLIGSIFIPNKGVYFIINIIMFVLSLLFVFAYPSENGNIIYRKRILKLAGLYYKDNIKSINSLKLDAYTLLECPPKHLKDESKLILKDKEFGTLSVYTSFINVFSIFKESLADDIDAVEGIEKKPNLYAQNPILNTILLDNIVILSTIVSIIKDEDLYKSLMTVQGQSKEQELINKLSEIKNDLENAKKTLSKSENLCDTLENLKIIDAMTDFSNKIK